jgi:glyoxylase-like metal-dependent hydrolase (beta-lactamase superfamily II)
MLRILGFGVLLILSGLGSFSQTVPDQGFFEDGTSALEVKAFSLPLDDPGATVNCYVVWHPDSRRAVVIDPGAPAPAVLEFIRERHLEALAILNTHGHYDHVGGDAFLAEKLSVPVYLRRADSDLASQTTGSGFPFTFYPEAGKLILGELEILVIPTPGHTPGSVCLRIGETIFSGDTLFAGAIGKAEGESEAKRQANLQLEAQNIRKFLLTLPPTMRVFPGHGPATTIGAEKAFNPYIIE